MSKTWTKVQLKPTVDILLSLRESNWILKISRIEKNMNKFCFVFQEEFLFDWNCFKLHLLLKRVYTRDVFILEKLKKKNKKSNRT